MDPDHQGALPHPPLFLVEIMSSHNLTVRGKQELEEKMNDAFEAGTKVFHFDEELNYIRLYNDINSKLTSRYFFLINLVNNSIIVISRK